MMKGRRAALLATSLTIALAVLPLGPAGAEPGDEAPVASGGSAQAPDRAFGDVGVAPAPTFDALLAEAPGPTAEPEIAAAVTGRAATALQLINDERTGAGMRALVQDDALNELAQLSAEAWSTGNPDHPDLSLPLPGYPAEDSVANEWYVVGDASLPIDAFASQLYDDILLDHDSNHIGIGYYVAPVDGVDTGYLWVLMVEYNFVDVGPSVPFHEEIAWMVWAGVTGGYSDGTFRRRVEVTRGQMAAFLYRFFTGGTPTSCESGPRLFSDIPADHAFCGEIEWLAGTGITGGYSDGTYRPNTKVNRQQMAAFLFRAVGPDGTPECASGAREFSDVPASHPYCTEIEWLAGTGITGGYSDGTFRPRTNVDRGQMSAFLFRTWSMLTR